MTTAQQLLYRPTLILNRNWTPVNTSTVKEAISLVVKGAARIIDENFQVHDFSSWIDFSQKKELFEGAVIRSAKLSIVPPEVILLNSYDGIAERSVVFSRRNIFKRDKYACQYCGKQYRTEMAVRDLTIDHVMPKSRGGISSWDNCVLACVDCNKKKADKTPDEAKMRLRKTPRKPKWSFLSVMAPGRHPKSWDHFVSEAYWNVELEP